MEFSQIHVIYRSLIDLYDRKRDLLRDMVACANEPERYHQKLSVLRDLSLYEHNLLTSLQNFETDSASEDFDDATLKKIKESIYLLGLFDR